MIAVLAAAAPGIRVVPPEASALAVSVDHLFIALLGVSTVLVLAVFALVLWFAVRYRAGSARPRRDPPTQRVAHRAEAAAVLVLLALFMIAFYWGGRLYLDEYRGPADVTTIDVVAKQWMWKIYHGNGAREINTMHVPVGDPVRLDITSEDVIHSFYVPAFRLKRDAVPGMTTRAWFDAVRPGTYQLFCAEYCGTNHAHMTGTIVVMTPSDYQHWLDAHARPGSVAAQSAAKRSDAGDSGAAARGTGQ